MNGELLYAGSRGQVAAIDPATGAEVWRTALFVSPTTAPVTVLQHEGRVFAGCFDHLFCLDGATGRVIWNSEFAGTGYDGAALAIAGAFARPVTHPRRPRR